MHCAGTCPCATSNITAWTCKLTMPCMQLVSAATSPKSHAQQLLRHTLELHQPLNSLNPRTLYRHLTISSVSLRFDIVSRSADAWTLSRWRTSPLLRCADGSKSNRRDFVQAGSQRVHSTMSKRRQECKEHPGEKGRLNEI
jgi:hypothetical protein